MENNIELQEMREQLASFKQQLAGQKIINDKLMRRAMSEKASRLMRKKNGILVMGLIAIFVSIPIFHSFGFPPYFLIYTAAMIIFSMAMTIVYHSKVDKADFMNGNLKEAATEFKKLRNNYKQWYWIAVPVIVIYMALFYYSSLQMDIEQEILNSLMIGGSVGALIGAFIGTRINNNIINLCGEIIRDLEEN